MPRRKKIETRNNGYENSLRCSNRFFTDLSLPRSTNDKRGPRHDNLLGPVHAGRVAMVAIHRRLRNLRAYTSIRNRLCLRVVNDFSLCPHNSDVYIHVERHLAGDCADVQTSPALDGGNHIGLYSPPRVRVGKFQPVS